MSYRIILLLLISTLLPQLVAASSQNQKFQEANGAYSHNDFSTAISIYETLIAENGYSPGVLYNLANSYAQIGSPGLAILNYERALRLAPGNSDITANLEKVRSEHGLFPTNVPLTQKMASALTMNQWGGVALLSLTAITVLVLATLYLDMPRRPVMTAIVCAGLVLLASGGFMAELRKSWHSSIITTTSPLLISPFEGAAKLGTAREGRRVFTHKQHGSYVYIKSETGRTGWMPVTALQPVIAATR